MDVNRRPMSNRISEEKYSLPENDMLESVFAKDNNRVMAHYNMKTLAKYNEDYDFGAHGYLKQQIATQNLHEKGLTSKYGGKSAGEMFAEAVADVYSHGSGAKEMSKELVKEYESRQKKRIRDKFNDNKKSWWRRFFGF